MQLQMHHKKLYAGVGLAAVFLSIAALGPGLFPSQLAYPFSWQYLIFDTICHQDATRSFMLNEVPMAVCARCIGIYMLFLVSWLLMPFSAYFSQQTPSQEKYWLIAAILLNLADVVGNYFGFWTNTHTLRFMLGGFLGWTLAFFLSTEFFTFKLSEIHYGNRT